MRRSFTYEGKRYFIRCDTEEEFIREKQNIITKIDNNIRTISKMCTVNKWAEDWVETYRPNASKKYAKHMQLHLNRFCSEYGVFQLKAIKQKNIQLYINSLKEMSKVTMDKNYQLIKAFFETAKNNGLILDNPADNIVFPKTKKPNERRPLTDEEREALLRVCEYHYGGLYMKIMLYCGLRTLEVAALIGKDIKDGYIEVSKTVKSDGSVGSPKSYSGVRKVPIPDVLLDELKKASQKPFKPVVESCKGKRYTGSTVEKMWKSFKICLEEELGHDTDLVMYCLRHTYCTDLQDAGVPINVAKDLMGHSSINVTAKIYTHRSEKSLENARNLINLKNGSVPSACQRISKH